MKIIDISWPISNDMTAYKDRKVVELIELKDFSKDRVRESKVVIGSHSGTHIDAPTHFLKDGSYIDQIPLDKLIGKCRVIDLTSVNEAITSNHLEPHDIQAREIILLKTQNSSLDPNDKFEYEFVYLDASGGDFLANKSIKAIGIDYLGIERNQPGHETHTSLLRKEIPIIEGLRLGEVSPGEYELYCLPLKVVGLEAAPARAILISP